MTVLFGRNLGEPSKADQPKRGIGNRKKPIMLRKIAGSDSNKMTIRPFLCLGGVLLVACSTAPPADPLPPDPRFAELETVFDGRCFVQSDPEEVTEIVTEQVMVLPETTSPDGSITLPPVFRDQTRPVTRLVDSEVAFETLCPAELTTDRIATLQRALKARLAFEGRITGIYDAATRQAVRVFQSPSGYKSDQIARDVAIELGIVAPPINAAPE